MNKDGFLKAGTLLFFLLCISACDDTPAATPSSCGANTAVIAVRDGFTEIFCGCQEAAGTIAASGTALTCTITHGSYVLFDFTSTKLTHQIVSTGTPSFADSALHDPNKDDNSSSHVVQFTQTGTFSFQDRFIPGMTGQIISQ